MGGHSYKCQMAMNHSEKEKGLRYGRLTSQGYQFLLPAKKGVDAGNGPVEGKHYKSPQGQMGDSGEVLLRKRRTNFLRQRVTLTRRENNLFG